MTELSTLSERDPALGAMTGHRGKLITRLRSNGAKAVDPSIFP
jgi:hypothetical protein